MWGYIVIEETEEGVYLQSFNGDIQYLTNEEYSLFQKNRYMSSVNGTNGMITPVIRLESS